MTETVDDIVEAYAEHLRRWHDEATVRVLVERLGWRVDDETVGVLRST